MTSYSKKNLNECLDSMASEKNISRQELGKNIYINDFKIVRGPSLFFNFFRAEKEFREMAEKYDSVINVKRSFNTLPLIYKISGTGVKLNNLNNLK